MIGTERRYARRFSRADGAGTGLESSSFVGIDFAQAYICGAWVKLNVAGTDGGGAIVQFGSGAPVYNLGPRLRYDGATGKFRTDFNNPAEGVSSITTPVAGVWYHVGFFYEGPSTDKLWIVVNGVPEASVTLSTDPTWSYYFSYPLCIGGPGNTFTNLDSVIEADIADPFFGYGFTVDLPFAGIFRRLAAGARPWDLFEYRRLVMAIEFGSPASPIAERSGNGNTFVVYGTSKPVEGPTFRGARFFYLRENPLPITTQPVIWLDAADGSTLTYDASNKVSSWVSKGSNTGAFTQSTSNKKPLYVGGAPFGSAVRFDYDAVNGQILVGPTSTTGLTDAMTIFVVHKPRQRSGEDKYGGVALSRIDWDAYLGWSLNAEHDNPSAGSSWTLSTFLEASSSPDFEYSEIGQANVTPFVASDPEVTNAQLITVFADLGAAYSGADATHGTAHWGEVAEGGDAFGDGEGVFNNPAGIAMCVGGYDPAQTSNLPYYAADCHEILLFGELLSESDRQAIEGYLAWKWRIEDMLPADHPYAPPSAPSEFVFRRRIGGGLIRGESRFAGGAII